MTIMLAPRLGTRCDIAGVLAAGVMLLSVTPAAADDACRKNSNGIPVPQCVTASHADTLKADQTQDIDIYCPSEAPYYWGGWVNTFSSIWHVITENLVVENIYHAHFKISNTRLGQNRYTVTIGCSPLPEFGQCTGNIHNVPDPRCPVSDTRQDCSPPPYPKCWRTWTEICTDGNKVTNYTCTNANPLAVTCATCNG